MKRKEEEDRGREPALTILVKFLGPAVPEASLTSISMVLNPELLLLEGN